MGAVHFSLDTKLAEVIKKTLQPLVFFETGTYKGDTVAKQLNNFKKIISVELSYELWKDASSRFEHDHHVEIIHGNSPQVLTERYNQLSQASVVYWLDAHWCLASGTAGEKSQCPLIEELQAIKCLNKNSMIIIDDARLFLAPPLTPHEVSAWPQLNTLITTLQSLSQRHELIVVNDMMLYYPISIKKEIFQYARNYGIDWLESYNYADEVIALKQVCEERLQLINHLHTECSLLSHKHENNSQASDYNYFIDFPRHRTHHKTCEITGWVFHKQGIPIKKIRLKRKEQFFEGSFGFSRPDVSKYFNNANESDASGIRIPIQLDFGLNEILIQASSKDDYWEPVGLILIKHNILLANILCECKIILIYLFQYLCSRKNIILLFQKKTITSIKDHLLFKIYSYFHHRKLSGLGHLVQHAPTSLVPEKYPKNHQKKRHCNKITIVTPSYNQGQFIEATIQSIINQNYPNLEYMVIDGGSQDESWKIINKYQSALSYCVSEKDEGQSDAIQKGLARCTGHSDDIMAYLNSDDLYLSGALPFIANYFQDNPEIDLIYGHRILIDENAQEIGRWFTPRHNNYNLSILDYVPQETMFWRRRLYDKVGGIDPKFHFAMDWDFLLRAQESGAVIKRVPYFLGCFRVHTKQKTSTHMNTIGEREVQKLRNRSHGKKISQEQITKVHNKNSIESALSQFLFSKGIRI